jgi:hypothetical protein
MQLVKNSLSHHKYLQFRVTPKINWDFQESGKNQSFNLTKVSTGAQDSTGCHPPTAVLNSVIRNYPKNYPGKKLTGKKAGIFAISKMIEIDSKNLGQIWYTVYSTRNSRNGKDRGMNPAVVAH